MENKDLICPICGEPTSVYMGNARKDRLCRKHAAMLKNGEIQQCEKCSTWKIANKPCKCENVKESTTKTTTNNSDELTCIICGENSYGKDVCKSCYIEIMNAQDELDKNKKKWELKDYYYNLKAFIGRLKNYDEAISNLPKLYAIAWLLKKLHNDEQLSDVVNNDVKYLIKQLDKIKNLKFNEQQQQNDKTIIAVANIEKNRASDGHICKSEGEVIIDDILYEFKICHAYGLKVKEIPSTQERTVIADWFIPISGTKGIYIEYWGMDKQDYQDNKEEKLKLYEKYSDKVKLIQIEKNDIKDRQNLKTNLYQQLIDLGWNDNN